MTTIPTEFLNTKIKLIYRDGSLTIVKYGNILKEVGNFIYFEDNDNIILINFTDINKIERAKLGR